MKSIVVKSFVVLLAAAMVACQSSESLTDDQLKGEAPEEVATLAEMIEESPVFSANLTGVAFYDPEDSSMIYSQNGDHYFTPASNTKLFTFYTGLKMLPDSIKALEYEVRGDSLIFWGTGDPSFLHPDFGNDKVYEFLKDREEDLYFADTNFDDELLGPGWSWSDYQYYYQPEKVPFPIVGNIARFTIQEIETRKIAETDSGMAVSPKYFREYIEENEEGDDFLYRGMTDNTFDYKLESDTSSYTIDKPFHYDPELVTQMLSDTLGKKVEYIDAERPKSPKKLYSIKSDTAYKRMLRPSDNFIAEQLLLVAASEMEKPLNSRMVIDKMKEDHLDILPKEPQWVDGSGLSRYNMFTPASMIYLLEAIDEEFDDDAELFHLLPAGGENGTISSWYAPKDDREDPYVFAKTGTLSNNHSLSGYLLTESGKKLYFSFMNNHYVGSSSVVKQEMDKVLWYMHQNF
ncbi:MAG: D-alanyl-D-alanine carboxypeptidase/D-alanyl-D-alanine-endopeptidase [Bacteroidota bacterium]